VTAQLVFEGDELDIDLDAKTVRHNPTARSANETNIIGAYAYAVDRNGDVVAMVYATKKELEEVGRQRVAPDPRPSIRMRNAIVSMLQNKIKEQEKSKQ
jgi:hypothetical protein